MSQWEQLSRASQPITIADARAVTDVDVRGVERHRAVEPEQRVVDGVATWPPTGGRAGVVVGSLSMGGRGECGYRRS